MTSLGGHRLAARVLVAVGLIVGTMVAVGPATPASAVPASNDGVVYDSIPDPLPYPLGSVAFYSNSITEFGDIVQLAPGSRQATSFDTVLTSWVCGNHHDYRSTLCETTPETATFAHEITLTFYEWNFAANARGAVVGAPITQEFDIPFRPSADADCAPFPTWFKEDGQCREYLRVPITFDFDPLDLPRNVVWSIAFASTGNGHPALGIDPMPADAECNDPVGGVDRLWCGYDLLNLGTAGLATPVVGVNLPRGAFAFWNGAYAGGSSWEAGYPSIIGRINTTPAAEADTTVVVRPGAEQGWAFGTDASPDTGQTGKFVAGPAPTPLGAGSAELALTGNVAQGQILGLAEYGGTPLANLTELAYSSNQPGPTSAVSLAFSVRYDGAPGGWQGRLVYEPYQTQSPVPAGWQTWDTQQGRWWASNAAGAPCVQASPCTWSQILERFPDAVINPDDPQVVFKAGTGWADAFTGNVDALAIGVLDPAAKTITTTTYDFEPKLPDYNPVTPTRLFDTRAGTPPALREVAKQQVGPSTPLEVQVTDLPGGLVPATGVGAVSLNVTAAFAAQGGYITVRPCGTPEGTSSVNFQARNDRANLVLVPVSAEGKVCFTADVPVDVVVDVNGWFTAGGGFVPVAPARVFDTRPGAPPALREVVKQQVGPSTPLRVKFTDLPGGVVPGSGVDAVSLNVTATGSELGGYLTVRPCDGAVGTTSNVNFIAASATANAVITPVSASGELCFSADVDTHVVVDVNGWIKDTSDFTALAPARVFDTRPGTPPTLRTVTQVKVTPSTPLKVKLTDLPGGIVPASGVGALSLTVTATNSDGNGYLSVTPCGAPAGTSNINFLSGVATANAVLTPVSSAGEVCFTPSVAADVIVDINGWFAAAP